MAAESDHPATPERYIEDALRSLSLASSSIRMDGVDPQAPEFYEVNRIWRKLEAILNHRFPGRRSTPRRTTP
jgi:hypothetical protein